MIGQGTVEEKVHQLQQEKQALFDEVIDAADASAPMSLNELKEILLG